ncbi:uL15 family ribosomal protein [Candidatus Woesearchaeota archaeon]|nr:uL15 family ribosomal protein [Candidatus Woesearchaeota archaeon]
MMHKRKKFSRQLGSRTYGWGKNHRGSGNRGGVGNSGRGKKAQSKKPQVWGTGYLGKYGFTSKSRTEKQKSINIVQLEELLKSRNTKDGNIVIINLAEEGYGKLLSTGKVFRKVHVIVQNASPKAVEKIRISGGAITILSESENEAQKEKAK